MTASRRLVLAGLGAAAVSSAAFAQGFGNRAVNSTGGPPAPSNDSETEPASVLARCQAASGCSAGIDSGKFQRVHAQQRTPVWCWAATLQMIFAWSGKKISQEEICIQSYGAVIAVPADPFTLMGNLNRRFIASDGSSFAVRSKVYSLDFRLAQIDNSTLVSELNAGKPLVYCNLSHMMALVQVHYKPLSPSGFPKVERAIVADPWPSSGPFRSLSNEEMTPAFIYGGRLRFVAAVNVA